MIHSGEGIERKRTFDFLVCDSRGGLEKGGRERENQSVNQSIRFYGE